MRCLTSYHQKDGKWYAIYVIVWEEHTAVFVPQDDMFSRMQVLLDPSMTKGKSKEWKEMRQELDRAGKLKV